MVDEASNTKSGAKPLETHEKWIIALAIVGWVVFIGFMLGITIF